MYLCHINTWELDQVLLKGVKADWALALRKALPKNQDEYKELQQNELFLITTAARQESTVLKNLGECLGFGYGLLFSTHPKTKTSELQNNLSGYKSNENLQMTF